ncbi:MAG: helix-turn-helix domain-containing protein [Candidatus Gastranaerophilaceae bacterium]
MRDKRLETLSINIKAERVRKKLTQSQLAQLTNVSERSISQIEQSKQTPSALVIFDIAKALGITVDELYKGL